MVGSEFMLPLGMVGDSRTCVLVVLCRRVADLRLLQGPSLSWREALGFAVALSAPNPGLLLVGY